MKFFNDAAGGEDCIVSYGDGTFPLVIKGTDGGSSDHGQLMVLLSKTNHILMTKACPNYKNKKVRVQYPEGNAEYYDSHQENTWIATV